MVTKKKIKELFDMKILDLLSLSLIGILAFAGVMIHLFLTFLLIMAWIYKQLSILIKKGLEKIKHE